MAELSAAFSADNARIAKTIVALDISESTGMKEQMREAEWITTYGWFYALLAKKADEHHGRIVKYLGDGALAVFEENAAAEAINFTIEIQEAIGDALAENRTACKCSVGITHGEVIEFEVAGIKDYIGTVVDKAFRLCSVANAWAIFVDPETTMAAAMNTVKSRLGMTMTPKRRAVQYQGAEQEVKVKGFSRPVAYHEILWAQDRFSVSPTTATELSGGKGPVVEERPVVVEERPVVVEERPVIEHPPPKLPTPRVAWRIGVVDRYDEKTYGFIKSGDVTYFVYPGALLRKSSTLKRGDEVAFIAGEPSPGVSKDGKPQKPSALNVIPLGTVLSGHLARNGKDGMYGFAVCTSDRGEEAPNIFVHFAGRKAPYPPGTEIEFLAVRGLKGDFSGEDVKERADPDQAGTGEPQSG